VTVTIDKTREWTVKTERGAVPLIKFFVWAALALGRPAARLLLYPICLYFLLFSPASRCASRQYLARALDRRPTLGDVFRHYHTFASCLLDRVFLLNDQLHLFNLQVHGEEIVIDILKRGSGCILLGAHFGSFEAARALGRRQPNLRISLVMYEENARKIGSVLNAINPSLATDIIALGRPDTMIEVGHRLDQGGFVGILADRSVGGEAQIRYPFLGAPAAFQPGPFRMAALLKRPVVLMVGIYRGGRRYDIFFERLLDPAEMQPRARAGEADKAMRRYVERLEHYCRLAPFNWFNFYDFWA
jgi:predicted LPLAT superfamily acyltransferase